MIRLTAKELKRLRRGCIIALKKPHYMSELDFAIEQGWITPTEPSTAHGVSITAYVPKKRKGGKRT